MFNNFLNYTNLNLFTTLNFNHQKQLILFQNYNTIIIYINIPIHYLYYYGEIKKYSC